MLLVQMEMNVSCQMGWRTHVSAETSGCGWSQYIKQWPLRRLLGDHTGRFFAYSLNVLECSALIIKRTGQSESDVLTIGLIAIVHVAIIP